jgi:Mrp family chromosome partitioning ATPase
MSLIAVATAKRSPGASTFAELAVLLGPEGERLLLDCDPAGSEWLLRPGVRPEPGLVTLAMAGRRELAAHTVATHAQTVGGLDVVVAPAAGRQASGALDILGDRLGTHLAGLGDVGVVADCGRLAPRSPALGVVHAADLVVLVSRCTVSEMVHLAPWVEQLRSEARSVAVVLVDRPRRGRQEIGYGPAEVAEALGVPVLGSLADDAGGAGRLFAQPGSLVGLWRTRLVRAARPVVEALWAAVPGPAAHASEAIGESAAWPAEVATRP